MRIAIVEDEKVIFERMRKALYEGFINRGIQSNISAFETSAAFIHTVSRETFDLVLLDWHLPDGTGIDLLDWMKRYLKILPAVVIVTHRQEEVDVIQALDAGADDFISKPFRPRELAARAYAASRRKTTYTTNQAHQLEFGCIKLNTQKETACISGQNITLTHQEFRLAYLLLNRLDSPLSRAYLYKYVWGRDNDLNTRTLDVHIHRIRKKLLLTAEHGWNLVSVYGYGYRLRSIEENSKTLN
ncbi:MAG: response regulator transcription factor [Halomonas sp.]|nr:response regulator transcription factor [Halomonas sp.]MBP5978693.1 response regulator transcription factor [Halomonas sp.]